MIKDFFVLYPAQFMSNEQRVIDNRCGVIINLAHLSVIFLPPALSFLLPALCFPFFIQQLIFTFNAILYSNPVCHSVGV